jgi:SagB-type dehydrogenase family enzyme
MPYRLKLSHTVSIKIDGDDLVLIGHDHHALRLTKPGVALKALLVNLTSGDMTADQLVLAAAAAEVNVELSRLYFALASFEKKGFVCYSLAESGNSLMTLQPISPSFRFEKWTASGKLRLSRFACLRREGDAILAESPLGHARLLLHDSRLGALATMLALPCSINQLAAAFPGFDDEILQAIVVLWRNAGLVFCCDAEGRIAEETDSALQLWEFHDLLFHRSSRSGRHEYPLGGTYRFKDKIPHAAALKAPMSEQLTVLYRPAADSAGPDFFALVEARRSRRTPAAAPITLIQLGEFLWRSARVQTHLAADPLRSGSYEASLRPYPSGGATHELELYLTVSRCTGLESGFYHYDPMSHELERLSDLGEKQQSMLRTAMYASALTQQPDILITIAARFGRVTWKYEGLAYALIQKHVGALYQQMYLVGTALELAPCGLGVGNSDTFAAAIGTDYFTETSVGDFILSAT